MSPHDAGRRLRPSVILAVVWSAALVGTLTVLPLLRVAANRLVVGDAVYGVDALGRALPVLFGVSALVGALFILFSDRARMPALAASVLLAGALAVLALGLGDSAARHLAGRPPAARASLGAGAWCAAFLLLFAFGFALRRSAAPSLTLILPGLLLATLVATGHNGAFDGLSLVMEYAARREIVNAALGEHIALAAGAVALGSVGAVVLFLWRGGRGVVELAIGGIQVVPAVALFGALVALTSGLLRHLPGLRDLGLAALGPVPALVGIAAYLLLPLWRGLSAALRAPDPATLEAAEALGLSRAQVLARIRLPLGAPILIGALRVAAVQSLGLATLGALIGAGGLGRIVFDGMAQFAPDLILLGALPVVGLSLIAERGLGLAEARAQGRWR